MTIRKLLVSVVVVPLVIAGCSTISEESIMAKVGADSEERKLTKVGAKELHDLVIGNTTTQATGYGRWAEYHATDETSYARAWGDWGRQDADSTHVTHPDGTMCHQYTGPYKWAGPDHEYCGVVYEDKQGNYYYKVLKNTNKPDKVGDIMEMEIKSGDPYGLAE